MSDSVSKMEAMIRFNDDDTNRGIEAGAWEFDGGVAVEIKPTNHWFDWITNVTGAWPRGHRQHRIWRRDAQALVRWLESKVPASRYTLIGISRGGAIGIIAADILTQHGLQARVITMGSPKPGRIHKSFLITQYRVKGDLVPFLPLLYPRVKFGTIWSRGQWAPFWKAHAGYWDLLREVRESCE